MQCQPGDQVTLNYIHEGTPKEANTTLGEHLVNVNAPVVGRGVHSDIIQSLGLDEQLIDKHMQQHMQEMKKILENRHDMQMDLHGLMERMNQVMPQGSQGIHDIMNGDIDQLRSMKPSDPPEGMNIQFSSSSKVIRRDREGSITLKTMNGLKELIVKDNQGNVVYEGPYKTDEQKAAVPEDIRIRLNKLNFDKDNDCGFRLHIDGGEMKVKPPAETSPDIQ